MADREKVINGLEHHSRGQCSFGKDDICPYWSEENDSASLCRDALELLKTQEPRVLTVEEVIAFDWDHCYLEEVRLPGQEYRAVCGDHALTCITWPCVASMQIQYGAESYGKKWRCWSAKPTEEQRKAVAWSE